ncbi:muconolactone Delta-isomerase [Egicoccus sp. AB-alg2]|uniref:muconolactone Delta-isomerase n=1 Tax=Egicoccus sp. AB-alg2 TaxID=3242693 RepID=UPI00359CE9C3
MDFLVRTTNNLPVDTPEERRRELQQAERARAAELREAGLLKKLWRVPGTRSSIGWYEAKDATELHEALSSLAFFPWMDIVVEPLATHPQEQ